MDVEKLNFDFENLSNETLEIDQSVESTNWFEQVQNDESNDLFSIMLINVNSIFNN